MSQQTPGTPGTQDDPEGTYDSKMRWPLWEVFVRSRRGLSHNHVGSLHAADEMVALQAARDLYTRRQEGVSIWVVPSSQITASSPDEKDEFFDPAADKIFRYPTFFKLPAEVDHM